MNIDITFAELWFSVFGGWGIGSSFLATSIAVIVLIAIILGIARKWL